MMEVTIDVNEDPRHHRKTEAKEGRNLSCNISENHSKSLNHASSPSAELKARKSLDPNGQMPQFSVAQEHDKASSSSKENAASEFINCASQPVLNAETMSPPTPAEKKPPIYTRSRTNSKSRLLDPVPSPHSNKSNSSAAKEKEKEDPFKHADLPEKYRRRRFTFGLRCGFWRWFQWIAFFVSVAALICSHTLTRLRNQYIWGLELWKWALTMLVIFSGRLVSGWLIHIAVFFIEKNFMLRKRVVYFVYGLRRGVQTCLWISFILLAWTLLLKPKADLSRRDHKALMYVTKLIISFLIAAVLWLIKLLGLKILASNYHVSTYFERIQDALFHQHILEALSGLPISDDMDAKDAITIGRLQKLNRRNVSAWNMKRLVMKIRHHGLSTLSQRIDDSVHLDREYATETESEAVVAAKHILTNVAGYGRYFITIQDMKRFLEEEDAKKAFCLFDGAVEHNYITKDSLLNWVMDVYQERRKLALSLGDTQTAVHRLHLVVNVLLIIVIIVISLMVLGIATTKVLILVSGQVVLIAFVFGNACKRVFEALIFLFIMHPFDVGDRCVIDGVQMVVEEMNILTTVFLKADNEKVYYPNSVLATKAISNFYRSPDMHDAINFAIHISTSSEQITELKQKINEYIGKNAHHWRAQHSLNVKEIEDMNKMKMTLWLQHASNHQNPRDRAARISDLILALRGYCQELGITYHLPTQEIQLHSKSHMQL